MAAGHPAQRIPLASHVCAFCKTQNPGGDQSVDAICRGCGGPLRLIDLPTGNPTRRETQRIELQDVIHYRIDSTRPNTIPGQVVDLSPTGLRFLSEYPLTAWWVIKIDGPTLSAVARVTRSLAEGTDGLFSTGVRFLTLSLGSPRGTFVSEQA